MCVVSAWVCGHQRDLFMMWNPICSLSQIPSVYLFYTNVHTLTLYVSFFGIIYFPCHLSLRYLFLYSLSLQSLLKTCVCVCVRALVYAKCPGQQGQTALIHLPRGGSIYRGEGEAEQWESKWLDFPPSQTDGWLILLMENFGFYVSIIMSDHLNLRA